MGVAGQSQMYAECLWIKYMRPFAVAAMKKKYDLYPSAQHFSA